MTRDHIPPHSAGDKVEMDSYAEGYSAGSFSGKLESSSVHDDAASGSRPAEVGKGLQRNLQARHLTMISLGKSSLLRVPRSRRFFQPWNF